MDARRREVLRLLASVPLIPAAMTAWLTGCDDEGSAAGAGTGGSNAPGATGGGEAVPEKPPAWAGKRKEYDLVERLNFASLGGAGASTIDLGSSDRYKYMLGGWRTGWGRFRTQGDQRYTHAISKRSRLFVHLDRAEELTVRFRVKRFGARQLSLWFNGKPVDRVELDRADWATYAIRVPAELVRAGLNRLLLQWDATQPVMGEDLAAGVASVELAPAAASRPSEAVSQGALIKSLPGGKQALELGSGARVSYWMQVPSEQPLLGLKAAAALVAGAVAAPTPAAGAGEPQAAGAAAAKAAGPVAPQLKVVAHRDGAPSQTLLDEEVSIDAAAPEAIAVDMSSLAGQVVRLDIEVSPAADAAVGGAKIALLEPAIYGAGEATTAAASAAAATPKQAKHVIVVMEDTLRADHVSAYRKTRVKTPALERFAKEGVLFERFSAVEDWTKPSCATMLTGLYPDTHKTQTDSGKLPASVRMVTEELQGAGIKTGAFIANGYVSDKFGFGRGWDAYTNYIRETKNTEAENVFRDAGDWIEKQVKDGERVYAYVHTIDPHVPYAPPREFLDQYDGEPYEGGVKARSTAKLLEDIKRGKFKASARDRRRIKALYDGEISYHDRWFGKFMERLDALGIAEDTLVIVVSDHGEEFWDHGSVGHGHQIHQELIHVPFIARWKGVFEPGSRVADNNDHACMVPTMLDALGVSRPDYLDGNSVLARAKGEPVVGPHAGFSTHQGDRQAVWSDRWKFLMRGPARASLFDVDADRHCKNDLSKTHPITMTYMGALLGQFQGAGNKRDWRSMATDAAGGERKVKAEQVEMDDEMQKQLENLGYFQR